MKSVRHPAARRIMIVVALALALAALACGSVGAAATSTPQPSGGEATSLPAATTAPEPSATPVPQTGGAPLKLSVVAVTGTPSITSSDATMTLQFDGTNANGDPATLTVNGEYFKQLDPPVFGFNLNYVSVGMPSGSTFASGNGTMNILTAEGTSYFQTMMNDTPTCFGMPASSDMSSLTGQSSSATGGIQSILNGSSFPEIDLADPNAEVIGIPAYLYHGEHIHTDTMNDATVDIWVTHELDTVLKAHIVDSGTFASLGTGDFDMAYEVTSVNQPIDYTIPEDCNVFTLPTATPQG